MTVPYTVTTPEYVAWAKKGEQDGETDNPFTNLVDELCGMADAGDVDWKVYDNGREKLKDTFDLHPECDCE
jgi:hypothetical protein